MAAPPTTVTVVSGSVIPYTVATDVEEWIMSGVSISISGAMVSTVNTQVFRASFPVQSAEYTSTLWPPSSRGPLGLYIIMPLG